MVKAQLHGRVISLVGSIVSIAGWVSVCLLLLLFPIIEGFPCHTDSLINLFLVLVEPENHRSRRISVERRDQELCTIMFIDWGRVFRNESKRRKESRIEHLGRHE